MDAADGAFDPADAGLGLGERLGRMQHQLGVPHDADMSAPKDQIASTQGVRGGGESDAERGFLLGSVARGGDAMPFQCELNQSRAVGLSPASRRRYGFRQKSANCLDAFVQQFRMQGFVVFVDGEVIFPLALQESHDVQLDRGKI